MKMQGNCTLFAAGAHVMEKEAAERKEADRGIFHSVFRILYPVTENQALPKSKLCF